MPSKQTTLASRIKEARSFTGLSSERFAEAIGTSARNLPRWERGYHSPSPRSLHLIAAASGVSVEWLTGSTEELHPHAPSLVRARGSRSGVMASNQTAAALDREEG